MAKPNWTKKEIFLTDKPISLKMEVDETFTVYATFNSSQIWWAGWKNYSLLWTALRYGMGYGYNKNSICYIKNNKTNEIVWRSWEDENPYRDR